MVSVSLVFVIIGILLYNLYKWMLYKPPNFPPGPPRIPLLGGYIWLLLINYNHFQNAINVLCKYYKTNVLGLYYANVPLIALNDAESVREALFHRDFDGKPDGLMVRLRDPKYQKRGILFTDGPFWKHQRRYTLRHLRDYGFDRRFEELEIEIDEEIKILIDIIRYGPKYAHESKFIENDNILCPQAFMCCAVNCFMKTLCNERVDRAEQHWLFEFAQQALIFQKSTHSFGNIYSVIPSLGFWFPKITGYVNGRNASLSLYSLMKKMIDEKIATFDPNHVRCILDLYIKELVDKETKKKESFFMYDQLIHICIDFSAPSSNSIPMTIAFLFHKLVLYPEIQKKIQTEIDEVVGNGRLPSLNDRINLPYTEATIREIMRLETLVPNGIPHRSLEDTTFRGYDIPKGTVVMPLLHGIHMDPNKWEDPMEFRPERMLTADGKINLQKDFSLPFGAGKRLCAGETFSRNIVFLIVSALLQNFNIKETTKSKLPIKVKIGFISYLPDFYLKFEPR